MTRVEGGRVYLVGAGPGDPDLLTLRAFELLRTGDVVYHDDLVPKAILALIRPSASVASVGKRRGAKRVTQNEINQKLIVSAKQGLSVIRLKSGDPMIFGRAREEIEALTLAGVPYEVVPGVTVCPCRGRSPRLFSHRTQHGFERSVSHRSSCGKIEPGPSADSRSLHAGP